MIQQMGGSVLHNWTAATMEQLSYKTHATFIYSNIVSIYCLGGMVGGFITNIWSNIFGRKWGIVANNLFILISAGLMGELFLRGYCEKGSYWVLFLEIREIPKFQNRKILDLRNQWL